MEDEFRKDYLGYKEFEFVNSLENRKENEEILAEIKNKINNEIENYYNSNYVFRPEIKLEYTYGDGVGIFAFEHQLYVYYNERGENELYGPYNVDQAFKVALKLNTVLINEEVEFLEIAKSKNFYK